MDRYARSRHSPPPRDRPHRPRDDHPNVEYFGEGESYRPGGSTGEGPYRPPNRDRPSDSWSAERRDGRRDDRERERRDDIDSYIPATSARAPRPRSRSPAYRRRSRTPPGRGREDLFPSRRSPPPARRHSPRRSPPRRRSRSAYGSRRSPPSEAKRYRDASPDPSRRSPKRERRVSPDHNRFDRTQSPSQRALSPDRDSGRVGESYRPRSRSPPRRRPGGDEGWRSQRRSPSPAPRASGPASNNTSRRSSPPIHPDRLSLTGSGSFSKSPAPPSRPGPYDRTESVTFHDRSPLTDTHDQRPRSRDVSTPQDDGRPNSDAITPSGLAGPRNGIYDRPPPTGPSRSFSQPLPQATGPLGPTASPVSVSAHARGGGGAGGASTLGAPTRPRGPAGRFDGPTRDFSNPALRVRGSLTYRSPTAYSPRGGAGLGRGDFGSPTARGDYGAGRGDYGGGRGDHGAGRGDYGSVRADFGGGFRGGFGRGDVSLTFRGNSSASAAYPRTQRFNPVQHHLSTMEKVVPGGKLLPSGLPPEQEKRMKNLELEAERLRAEIADKQKTKRQVLNELASRERESERDMLRSELAESHLHQLISEDDGMRQAAF